LAASPTSLHTRWSLTNWAHRLDQTTNCSTNDFASWWNTDGATGSNGAGEGYNDSDEGFHGLIGWMFVIKVLIRPIIHAKN